MTQPGFVVHPVRRLVTDEQISRFSSFAVSNISDAMSRTNGTTHLRAFHRGETVIGRALTVKTMPADNLMVHKAIDMAGPGDVIVVDAGGQLFNATIGELMSTYARSRGVAGFVIDGAIRDRSSLALSDFPVFARGVSHRGPSRQGPGEINVPVCVDAMVVMPGDLIVGDADGVLSIRPDQLEPLARLVQEIEDKERLLLAEIAAGSVDRAWVDEILHSKGATGI